MAAPLGLASEAHRQLLQCEVIMEKLDAQRGVSLNCGIPHVTCINMPVQK